MKKLFFSIVFILSGTFLFASNGESILDKSILNDLPSNKITSIDLENKINMDKIYLCCASGNGITVCLAGENMFEICLAAIAYVEALD